MRKVIALKFALSPSKTSVAAVASALTFAHYLRKSRREGGSFVVEIQTGRGSWASGNPGERGEGKKTTSSVGPGDVDFFWNNPLII